MLTILVVAFVSAYLALVALGHVLLFTAIWPDFLRRRVPRPDAAAGLRGRIHQPN